MDIPANEQTLSNGLAATKLEDGEPAPQAESSASAKKRAKKKKKAAEEKSADAAATDAALAFIESPTTVRSFGPYPSCARGDVGGRRTRHASPCAQVAQKAAAPVEHDEKFEAWVAEAFARYPANIPEGTEVQTCMNMDKRANDASCTQTMHLRACMRPW